MIDPKNAIGKPVTIRVGGEVRQIGVVTHATIQSGDLFIRASLDLSEEGDRDEV